VGILVAVEWLSTVLHASTHLTTYFLAFVTTATPILILPTQIIIKGNLSASGRCTAVASQWFARYVLNGLYLNGERKTLLLWFALFGLSL